MCFRMKEWLRNGAIPDDENLTLQLCGPGYHVNQANKLVIEPKEGMKVRGLTSPDDADALALTFKQPLVSSESDENDSTTSRVIPIGLVATLRGWDSHAHARGKRAYQFQAVTC